jgi:hypothetical protein
MTIGEDLWVVFVVGVTVVGGVAVVMKWRRLRHFAYFRVIDEETKQPLVGAEVFRVRGGSTGNIVVGAGSGARVLAGTPFERRSSVGVLDAKGEFRGVFGHNSGAFVVNAPGLVSGLIGSEWVSEYDRFPAEPYVCTVRMGSIAPPAKSSPIRRGLAPGEVSTVAEGYLYLYEKPDLHEAWLCWATLEEAKTHAKGTAMNNNYWKLRGNVVGPGIGGSSCLIEAESVERA